MWNLMNKLTSKTETESEQADSSEVGEVAGWKDPAKRKNDSWTWTTVYGLQGRGGRNGG